MIPEEGPAGAPAGPSFTYFRQQLHRLDQLSYGGVVIAMGVMAVLVSVQVFFRYALSASIDWADEVARLAFVWAMFLAIPHGIRSGVHVGVDLVVKALGPRAQDFVLRAISALGAVFMGVVFVEALQVTAQTWQEMMPTLEVTSAVFYIAVVICAGHSCLHLALLVWGGGDAWQRQPRP